MNLKLFFNFSSDIFQQKNTVGTLQSFCILSFISIIDKYDTSIFYSYRTSHSYRTGTDTTVQIQLSREVDEKYPLLMSLSISQGERSLQHLQLAS